MKTLIGLILSPAVMALAAAALVGPVLIPLLHRLKFGQEIREEGPSWHQKKSGTPTMGGIIFIIGIVLSAVVIAVTAAAHGQFESVSSSVFMLLIALGFGLIGFIDDYIKVVKKRNLGLTSAQKFLLQAALAVIYILILYQRGEFNTSIRLPFGHFEWTMPVWLYVIFTLFVVIGTVNAVNLTDGLDGLASSVTVVVMIFFAAAAYIFSNRGVMSLASAAAGGLIGFLIFNHYPAKVFMGDTGSLFLGGLCAAMAVGMRIPIFLIIAGFVYFAETLSVIIQVAYFKKTGKRIFKMAPIHHHFEMCGWSEVKIVGVFTAVTAVLCAVSIAGLIL